MVGLYALGERQRRLQIESFGVDPGALEGEAKVEYLRRNLLGAAVEVGEVAGEIGWKPWRDGYGGHSRWALAQECADVVMHLLNVLLACGLDGGVLAEAIAEKQEVVARRQSGAL